MPVEQKMVYVCSDGKKFDFISDAQGHEFFVLMFELIGSKGEEDNVSKIADILIRNADRVREALESFDYSERD